MAAAYVVHRHGTGRTHFDLRFVCEDVLRGWSLLREPPLRPGQSRLAIERESFRPDAIHAGLFSEEAFGCGKVWTWDSGEVAVTRVGQSEFVLEFSGRRLQGVYRLSRTRWYPGNRWILRKLPGAKSRAAVKPAEESLDRKSPSIRT